MSISAMSIPAILIPTMTSIVTVLTMNTVLTNDFGRAMRDENHVPAFGCFAVAFANVTWTGATSQCCVLRASKPTGVVCHVGGKFAVLLEAFGPVHQLASTCKLPTYSLPPPARRPLGSVLPAFIIRRARSPLSVINGCPPTNVASYFSGLK